jgi:hypothetical protein
VLIWDWSRGLVAFAAIAVAVGWVWNKLETDERWIAGALLPFALVLMGWLVVDKRRASSRSETPAPNEKPKIISLVKKDFDFAMLPSINYKAKLRVVIRNDSAKIVVVHAPQWRCGQRDVGAQTPFCSSLQREGLKGFEADDWDGQEGPQLQVGPSRAVRAWIGLDSAVSDKELQRRLLDKQLGTVIFPITVDGIDGEVEFRV